MQGWWPRPGWAWLAGMLILLPAGLAACAPPEGGGENTAANRLAGKASGRERPDGRAAAGTKIFTDREGGFRVEYPAAWQCRAGAPGALIRADLTDGRRAGLQIRAEQPVRQTLAQLTPGYTGRFIRDMNARWPGRVEILEQGDWRGGGNAGFRAILRQQRGTRGDWMLVIYLWRTGNRLIAFQGGALAADWPVYAPRFEEIAVSLTFPD